MISGRLTRDSCWVLSSSLLSGSAAGMRLAPFLPFRAVEPLLVASLCRWSACSESFTATGSPGLPTKGAMGCRFFIPSSILVSLRFVNEDMVANQQLAAA
eukprot:5350960-Prymnesium_polylepis.2